VVVVLLFGSKKLPELARSLGRSARILKSEVGALHPDERDTSAPTASQLGAAPAPGDVPALPQTPVKDGRSPGTVR
jgi:sec-independent protein translocase protein TatA